MEEKKRVSKFTNFINAVRNANCKDEGVKKNTEEVIAYMQRSGTENMYNTIEQDTREKISKRMKEIEGQNSTFIAGYTREERTTDGFGIGEFEY